MLCNLKRRYEPTFDLELIFQILDKRLKGVLLHHLDPPSTFQPFSQTPSPSRSFKASTLQSFSFNLLVLLLHHLQPLVLLLHHLDPSQLQVFSLSLTFSAVTDVTIARRLPQSHLRNLRKSPQVPFQESQEIAASPISGISGN